MKILVIIAATVLSAAQVLAANVNSTEVTINPSSIAQAITLVDKPSDLGGKKRVQIVVVGGAMSTDVSPRYSVYLGFAAYEEMGNMNVDFKITDTAWDFKSAKRVGPGLYQVVVTEFSLEGRFVEATYDIDATQMFIDEKNIRANCGDGFCDQTFKSTLKVSRKVK